MGEKKVKMGMSNRDLAELIIMIVVLMIFPFIFITKVTTGEWDKGAVIVAWNVLVVIVLMYLYRKASRGKKK